MQAQVFFLLPLSHSILAWVSGAVASNENHPNHSVIKNSFMSLVQTQVLVEVLHYMYVTPMNWRQWSLQNPLLLLTVAKEWLQSEIFLRVDLRQCSPCFYILIQISQNYIPRLVPKTHPNQMITDDIARSILQECLSLMHGLIYHQSWMSILFLI